MRFSIVKFSDKKATKAVLDSSKIEGYKIKHDKGMKIKIHKIVSRLCS